MSTGLYFWCDDTQGVTDSSSPAVLGETDYWREHAPALEPWEAVPSPCALQRGRWWLSQRVTPSNRTVLCGPCSSSLDVAWLLHENGCIGAWDSVVCLKQWAGRGQLRRTWLSLPGNVFAAWVWPAAERDLENLMPCIVGYVLVKAFTALGVTLELKWPNDLLFKGCKVGGILVEERSGGVIVGVGLNLHHAPAGDALREAHAVAARSLPASLGNAGPLGLWLHLVEYARPCYRSLSAVKDPELISREIEQHMAFIGQRVRITGSTGPEMATVVGLAKDGKLRLFAEGAEFRVHAGSIIPL